MATAPEPGVTRERHGIFVDRAAQVTDDPEAPFGYDFDDRSNLTFWWSQGALGMWQVAEISLAEAEEHRLFGAPILAQVKALAELNGYDPDRVRRWEQADHAIVNFGHLREANTYAWRGDGVALASSPGERLVPAQQERIDRLDAAGKLAAAGRAAIEAARADGSWSRLDDVEDLVVPDDLAAAFEPVPAAGSSGTPFPGRPAGRCSSGS